MAVTGPSHRESSVTQPLLYINPFMIQIPVNRHNIVEFIFNLLQNMLNSKNKNIVNKINKVWKNYSHSSRLFPYSGSFLQISQGLISLQKPALNIQLFLILPKPEREIWDLVRNISSPSEESNEQKDAAVNTRGEENDDKYFRR